MRLPWTLQMKEAKGKVALVADLISSLPGVALPNTLLRHPKLGIFEEERKGHHVTLANIDVV